MVIELIENTIKKLTITLFDEAKKLLKVDAEELPVWTRIISKIKFNLNLI